MTPRKEPEERLKMGRPTLYKPEYCQRIIELGKLGKQTGALAAELEVTKTCLMEWCDVYPDFSYAFHVSRNCCEQFLIDLANKQAKGEVLGSSPMLKFLLSACHGLREKTDVNQTGSLTLIGSAAEIIKQVADGSTTDTANN